MNANPRPLRALMVSDVYFPRINGVSTSIETFRRALAEHNVELRLVVPRYDDEPDSPGIIRVPGRPVPRDPEDRIVHWRAMRATVRKAAKGCALVHVQTPFLAHYAGLHGARCHSLPTLLSYHTFFEEYLHHYAPFLPSGLLRALARRVSRSQCNAVDAVVVPSTAMRERLQCYGVEKPLHVLPTGIPLASFPGGDGARFRAAHGIAPDAMVALYVGRVAHEKNIGFLIKAAARLADRIPGFVLVIAGEGPAVASLREQGKSLGLSKQLRFIGYLDRSRELPDCYAAANVFAFASRTETQGLVLLEAMAAGLPVVALAAMGARDILTPGHGALTPEDTPEAFADALAQVLENPGLRTQLSSQALEWSRQWSEQAMAGRMAALYRQITNGTSAA